MLKGDRRQSGKGNKREGEGKGETERDRKMKGRGIEKVERRGWQGGRQKNNAELKEYEGKRKMSHEFGGIW